jgi:hypothetical protein
VSPQGISFPLLTRSNFVTLSFGVTVFSARLALSVRIAKSDVLSSDTLIVFKVVLKFRGGSFQDFKLKFVQLKFHFQIVALRVLRPKWILRVY